MAKVAPPLSDSFTLAIKVFCNAWAESPLLVGAEISVIELVISLPAPKIKAPLELNSRLAVPTILLATPA